MKTNTSLEKELSNAIILGNINHAISLIFNPQCNINYVDNYPLLMIAASMKQCDVIRALLKRKDLLINQSDSYGRTVLFCATHDCLDILVRDQRIKVNILDKEGKSALWWSYMDAFTKTNRGYKEKSLKILISHGARVEGIEQSVCEWYESMLGCRNIKADRGGYEIMDNWKTYLPSFKRFAASNKYYPPEFKQWAFNFVLCCTRNKTFCKDLIYLLLEYAAEVWKLIK